MDAREDDEARDDSGSREGRGTTPGMKAKTAWTTTTPEVTSASTSTSTSATTAPTSTSTSTTTTTSSTTGRFGSVVVRVKRKRHEIDEAPARILLPQKRVRAEDELADSLQALGVAKDGASAGSSAGDSAGAQGAKDAERGKKRAFVCELVPGASGGLHGPPGQQQAAQQVEGDALQGSGGAQSHQHRQKRLKYVDLELSEKGLRACEARQRRHDDELDFYLWHAASSGDLGLVNTVIEQPSRDVNFQRPADGLSALMVACMYADMENVAKYLALGADPSLMDNQGRDAAAHANESAEVNRQPSLKEDLFRMLGETEYVYDTYVVRHEVEWDAGSTTGTGDAGSSTSAQPMDVWRDNGLGSTWGDSVAIADQDLDMLGLFGAGGDHMLFDKIYGDADAETAANLTFSPAASEAAESELDDSDNELYRFNDYPEDEDEGLADSDEDADADADSD